MSYGRLLNAPLNVRCVEKSLRLLNKNRLAYS